MNDGGPAFPIQTVFNPHSLEPTHTGRMWDGNGMTLRQYYAAKAMQAILASTGADLVRLAAQGQNVDIEKAVANLCGAAVEIADAMIKAEGEIK